MTGCALVAGSGNALAQTAMAKRFGKFKNEEERAVRKPDTKADEAQVRLLKAWENLEILNHDEWNRPYERALSLTDGIRFSPEDMVKFCELLRTFQDEFRFDLKAGVFLNALMKNGKDQEYSLPLGALEIPIPYLCKQNEKIVTIEGNCSSLASGMKGGRVLLKGSVMKGGAGDYMSGGMIVIQGEVAGSSGYSIGGGSTAYEMKGGRIIIEGTARSDVGHRMAGGLLYVHSDVEGIAGRNMKGGKIVIEGSVRRIGGWEVYPKVTADSLKGGEIHVNGEIGEIGDVEKGRIYHKGKLIVDK